jgi:hypothetical protein
MERVGEYNAFVLSGMGALTLVFFYLLFKKDVEAPVPYHVAPPAEAAREWKGEVLDEPSLKVCPPLLLHTALYLTSFKVSASQLIQCYAPATGEALGRVNPSTASGIDRAIAKAKSAQKHWAQTSFAERRKVLKTMLQFVLANQEMIARVACRDCGEAEVDDCAWGEGAEARETADELFDDV